MSVKLLIIDDEPEILFLLNQRAQAYNMACELELTGEAGVKSAKTKNPDIILLDLMLPGISGIDVIKLLRSDSITKNIPIIMLSAVGQQSVKNECIVAGANAYFTKGDDLEGLFDLVNQFLATK